MEDEKKNPLHSDSNPNEGNEEVESSDLDDEESKGKEPEPTGKGDESDDSKNKEDEQKPGKSKQSREEDAKYAEERRKRKEREEAARKKHDEEVRQKALFEFKSEQVSADELKELGLQKVENADHLFLVEALRKAKSDGVENPVAYAYQTFYKKDSEAKTAKKAEEEAAKAAEEKRKAVVAEDQKNFKDKFGKTTQEVIKNEPEFMELFGKYLDADKGNFTDLYATYSKMKKQISETAKQEGAFHKHGGNGNGGDPKSEPKTLDEFNEYWANKYHS